MIWPLASNLSDWPLFHYRREFRSTFRSQPSSLRLFCQFPFITRSVDNCTNVQAVIRVKYWAYEGSEWASCRRQISVPLKGWLIIALVHAVGLNSTLLFACKSPYVSAIDSAHKWPGQFYILQLLEKSPPISVKRKFQRKRYQKTKTVANDWIEKSIYRPSTLSLLLYKS